jgi:hypothetical protein
LPPATKALSDKALGRSDEPAQVAKATPFATGNEGVSDKSAARRLLSK